MFLNIQFYLSWSRTTSCDRSRNGGLPGLALATLNEALRGLAALLDEAVTTLPLLPALCTMP